MTVIIRNNANKPIYQQLVDQIREQIIAGKLSAGQELPSIRALAQELQISVITTKRAYDELERDGFVVSVPGKGSYVAEPDREILRERGLRELELHIREALATARAAGLDARAVRAAFEAAMEAEDGSGAV